MAKLAVIKTVLTNTNVDSFLDAVADAQKQKDSRTILEMMAKVSGEKPRIWGTSLIGFGEVRVTSASGRQVDWFKIGFAPRKGNISLYVDSNVLKDAALMQKLGKYKTGVGCLYINKLADIDINVLEKIIRATIK